MPRTLKPNAFGYCTQPGPYRSENEIEADGLTACPPDQAFPCDPDGNPLTTEQVQALHDAAQQAAQQARIDAAGEQGVAVAAMIYAALDAAGIAEFPVDRTDAGLAFEAAFEAAADLQEAVTISAMAVKIQNARVILEELGLEWTDVAVIAASL